MSWNGVCSNRFLVKNGVKQGGVLSSILFCLYLDGLLAILAESNVACFIGTWYFGALAYADDIVLLAPCARAMRLMLKYVMSMLRDLTLSSTLKNQSVFL